MDVYTDRRRKNDLLNWLGTRHLGMTNCEGLKNITDENVVDKILQGSSQWYGQYLTHVPVISSVLLSAATGHTA